MVEIHWVMDQRQFYSWSTNEVKFEIWDDGNARSMLSRKKMSNAILLLYHKNSKVFIFPLFFSKRFCQSSFDFICREYKEGFKGNKQIVIVVATSSDSKETESQVSSDDIKSLTKEPGVVLHIEASAKTGENVQKILDEIVKYEPK